MARNSATTNNADLPTKLVDTTETALTSPTTGTAPPTTRVSVKADPTTEYVAAGGIGVIPSFIRALPAYIDDATRDFGTDLYDRMRHDPQVESAVSLLIMAALAQGWQVEAAVTKDDPRFAEAQRYADFVTWNLMQLNTPFQRILYELMMGCVYGHKIAEKTYDYATWEGRTRLVLDDIRPKPHNATAFVVDLMNHVVGIAYVRPGMALPTGIWSVGALDVASVAKTMLPRSKFVVFSFRAQNGDPRGQSILRSSYHAFWMKGQTLAKYLQFLATFAQPSIIGYTAPNSEPQIDPDNPLATPPSPEETMLTQLQKIQNGACGAFPPESKVEMLQVKGAGEVFLEAIASCNHEITKGILNQTLATDEALHMARAASETHQDVLGIAVRYMKNELADTCTRDICRPLIAINFGTQAALDLAPLLTLGATEHQDFASDARAVSALMSSGFIHWTQYTAIDAMLGLPARDMDEQMKDLEAEKQMLQAAQQELAQAVPSMTARVAGRQRGIQTVNRQQAG